MPPAAIRCGEATPLELELSVWGSGSGPLRRRYTDILCHFRAEKSPAVTTLAGRITDEDPRRMVVTFDLPPFTPADGTFVDYRFELKLDGQANRRDGGHVPLE